MAVDSRPATCYWEANQLKAQFEGNTDNKGEHIDVGFTLGPSPHASLGSFDLVPNANRSFAFAFRGRLCFATWAR